MKYKGKQYDWLCYQGSDPGSGVKIKASTASVAANLFAKQFGVEQRLVKVQRWRQD